MIAFSWQQSAAVVWFLLLGSICARAEDVSFKDIMHMYSNATSLQVEEIERNLPGNILVGSGEVVEVAECGFWDSLYCREGLKVVVAGRDGVAYVYFSTDARHSALKVQLGQTYKIRDCEILDIKEFITENSIFCSMAE